jgi:hypothetical protein
MALVGTRNRKAAGRTASLGLMEFCQMTSAQADLAALIDERAVPLIS